MKIYKKLAAVSLSAATSLSALVSALPVTQVQAAETTGALESVEGVSVEASGNVVDITFNGGLKGKITFLEEGIFRYNVDPSGDFSKYATPRSSAHTARIQQYPDESDNYSHPEATVEETDTEFIITSGTTKIIFNKNTATMAVKSGDKTVLSETEPLNISSTTSQTLAASEGEDFYGGGTQNGRFVHTGTVISISNTNNWVDGGVASPNPFYWSTNGYGVLRNTFAAGSYDFNSEGEGTISTGHGEKEFDAYYFVSDKEDNAGIAQDILQDYFQVTGNPVLLPEYGFYLGHLNCYNRDGWSSDTSLSGGKTWTHKGSESATEAGESNKEFGMASGYIIPSTLSAETLNGTAPTVNADNFVAKDTPYEFSARAVIDRYQENDMPFGWFLPNDGYGCGYGQNGYDVSGGTTEERTAAVDANVANLAAFTEYAVSHGVNTGLWTQSNLTPIATEKQQLQRDFAKEVSIGGITTLKTDVAWVGSGYSFGLNGIKQAYDIVTTSVNKRPNIVTLDGWAGTQRYGAIWTGDQYGGNWEYIRFHIPTFIGQSLAGNPNFGNDDDGIFGGAPIIATRDYQWKTFSVHMLDMDGWGSYIKSPSTHGDPYTGISRMYLKLKAQLMPYIYTTAASAANIDTENEDTGLPMARAMMLVDDSDYAASINTQYQYMFGDSFLVAPVYQDTNMEEDGDDIRNDIFLPGDENDIWIDYFTGDQYRGGQVIHNFDAPLWKLPLFVRAGAIIPMYEENNNPLAVSETNPDGLDKTQRIVEFYPKGTTSYTLYEDDGETAINTQTTDAEYGTISSINYGGNVKTLFTSDVDDEAGTVTLTAHASEGDYEGYDPVRNTQFTVNVSEKPSGVVIDGVNGNEVDSLEAFEALGDDESGWFYDAAPEMNKYSDGEDFANTHIINSPKVYVKFAKTNVNENEQTAVINGFVNDGDMDANVLVESLAVPTPVVDEEALTPTSITLNWDAIEGAVSYDILADGVLNNSGNATTYTQSDLSYDSEHTYQVRVRTQEGYSNWSEPITVRTLLDPWRNVPFPENVTWSGNVYGSHYPSLAFDHIFQSGDGGWHSNNGGINDTMIVDYGLVYNFEKLEYYPRDDAGNGTVTSMDIAYSIDGQNWTELPRVTWAANNEMKTVELNAFARYIRMIPRTSVGTFFSASEIAIYKKDGTNGFVLGSNLMNSEVTDGDYSNMKNYLALENKEPYLDTFNAQIRDHFADIDGDGVYGVYDYAFTMANLDGGTKKTGDASGLVFYSADKDTVEEGDIVTVTLYGEDVVNANAIGGLFRYDSADFEIYGAAGSSEYVKGSAYLDEMENLSKVMNFDDGTTSVNIAFANRGDKSLYSGTGPVATFQLRAKTAGNVNELLNLNQESVIVGPTFSTVKAVVSHDAEIPEVPTLVTYNLAESDFSNISITNEFYPEDDGTNVSTLIHQGNYHGLFDGSYTRDFELLWSTNSKFDETITVPLDLSFDVAEPKPLDQIKLYAGATTSNGPIVKHSATMTFEDGTTQEFSGGAYAQLGTEWTYVPSEENKDKNVTNFTIHIEETKGAQGLQNMTLCEIEFQVTEGVAITGVNLDASNASTIEVGQMSRVRASIVPAETNNQYYRVTSSNPEVAYVDLIGSGENVAWYVKGLSEGTATITVSAAGDPSVSTSYELTVSNDIDTTALTDALNKAKAIPEAILLPASYTALSEAVEEAETLLASDYTKDEIVTMTLKLERVLAALSYRTPDTENIINKTAESPVSVVNYSSECGTNLEAGGAYASMTLDKDEETYWHSNWSTAVYMPQFITYDLGAVYSLSDVSFLPRTTGYNGDIFTVELYAGVSEDDLSYIGTYDFERAANGYQLADRTSWHTMTFAPVDAQFVKFNVVHSGGDSGNDRFCSMSEIRFYEFENADVEESGDKTLLNWAVSYAYLQKNDPSYANVNTLVKERFEAALANAETVLADRGATQATIDAAWRELTEAIHMLGFTADKSELLDLVNQAREIQENLDDYQGDLDAFLEALEKAEDVLASDTALDESIQKAIDDLRAAMDGLSQKPVEEINTYLLELMVSVADQVDLDKYVLAGQAEFITELEAAKAVLENPETQLQVDNAVTALNTAYMNLRLKADESLLRSLVEFVAMADGIDRNAYTAEQLSELDSIVDTVRTALNNHQAYSPEMTQDDAVYLSQMAERGKEIISLIKPIEVNKTSLGDLISKMENKDQNLFTPDSWDQFEKALANSKLIYDDPNADQLSVDLAAADLESAERALVEKTATTDNKVGASTNANATGNQAVSTKTSGTNTAATVGAAGFTTAFVAAGAAVLAALKNRKNRK